MVVCDQNNRVLFVRIVKQQNEVWCKKNTAVVNNERQGDSTGRVRVVRIVKQQIEVWCKKKTAVVDNERQGDLTVRFEHMIRLFEDGK